MAYIIPCETALYTPSDYTTSPTKLLYTLFVHTVPYETVVSTQKCIPYSLHLSQLFPGQNSTVLQKNGVHSAQFLGMKWDDGSPKTADSGTSPNTGIFTILLGEM